MSVQRSPPSRTPVDMAPSCSISTIQSHSSPDLSKLSATAADSHITMRNPKRKQPLLDDECACANEIKHINSELGRISDLLEKYIVSNELIMNKMQESLKDVNTQIYELKLCNEQTMQLICENTTQINEIKSSTSNIVKGQQELHSTVTQLEKQVREDSKKILSLELDLSALQQSSLQPESSKIDNKLHSNEQIIKEVTDRKAREKNIIIAGVSEQTASDRQTRLANDEQEVWGIITKLCQDPPKPIKVFRVGKYTTGKHRSIKVCFNTADSAKNILKNRDKLPQNINIYSDQTPAQQLYLRSLKEELTRRQNDGESDITIKYIHGTPTIVKNPTKNSK